jgi:murein DD-endopeptidase MepM/ murein hydrolase activator NlpD
VAGLAALFAAPAGDAETGGASYVPKPEIRSVKCAEGCLSGGSVRGGGLVKVRGSKLASARKVIFHGGAGKSDNVTVKVDATGDSQLPVRVPYSAATGPLRVVVNDRVRSNKSGSVKIVPAPPPLQRGKLATASGPADPGAPKVKTAVSDGIVFVGGRGARFSYVIEDGAPADVVVRAVRLGEGDDRPVRTWRQHDVDADDEQTITWDGSDEGEAVRDGRYAFRLVAKNDSGATVQNAREGDERRDAFDLRGYIFPLRASHDYGDGFGAGRGHEGQDIFADCGSKIVAARGGRVKKKAYHSAAGNYVVIDNARSGEDFAYMHMREPSPLDEGDEVYTGQRIGSVGDTGRAWGCHLHFEMWTSPGWYSGGHAVSPTADLKAWDRYS